MFKKNIFRPSTIRDRKNIVMDRTLVPFVLLYAEKNGLYFEEAVTQLLARALMQEEHMEMERKFEIEMCKAAGIPEELYLNDNK